MANKVVKFGGSSLADANQFRKVASIIKSTMRKKISTNSFMNVLKKQKNF